MANRLLRLNMPGLACWVPRVLMVCCNVFILVSQPGGCDGAPGNPDRGQRGARRIHRAGSETLLSD
jgi:hypothetical protein